MAGVVALCSWVRRFTLTKLLPAQIYKQGPTNLRWILSIALRIPNAHAICVLCARINERVLAQNVRDFPRSELDGEINAPFLLNKHGDLYFLLHKNIVRIILFNYSRIQKNLSERKKDIAESVRKTVTPTCKLWPGKQQLYERITSTSF